jgi:hypothetical protein
VKGWIDECDRSHENCRKLGTSKLPTRVIDVSLDGNDANVCLIVGEEKKVPYAALSYCWGKSNFATTTETLGQYAARLPVSQLPRTIQDAIFCTRGLGIRYLWVDALCILQDSETDKARELSTMSETYQNAYITISAARSSDSKDGFLKEREFASAVRGWPIPYLPFRCQGGEIGTVGLLQLSSTKLRDPISTRGWTLQEHMLSPRLLIYGTLEVYWSCFTKTLPEQETGDYRYTPDDSASRYARGLLLGAHRELHGSIPESDNDKKHPLDRWWEIVEEYSCRALTYPHDKLPALSAIAATFNDSSDKYIAGLWSRWLLQLLAWRSTTPYDAVRLAGVAPSWSWASLAGEVEFLLGSYKLHLGGEKTYTDLVDVVECTTMPKFDFAPYGEITNSRLIMRGHLEPTPWDLRDMAFHGPGLDDKDEFLQQDSPPRMACLDSLRENESANEPLYSMPIFAVTIKNKISYRPDSQCLIGLLLRGTIQKFRRVGVYTLPCTRYDDYRSRLLYYKSEIVELI